MKRIVIGHFADPSSTRELVGISQKEFDVLCISLNGLAKKYEFAIELSDDVLMGTLSEALDNPNATEFQKENFSKTTPESIRSELANDITIIKKIKERTSEMKSKNVISEMKNISIEEYRVLIDSLMHATNDTIAMVNLTNEEIEELIKYKMSILGRKKEIDETLIKLKDPNYREELYENGTIAYQILTQINTPYEGAIYLDKNGSEADTSGFFGAKKQEQKHDVN